MLREVVLDTETTGLSPAEGHRLVEVAAVELLNHVPTGRHFHSYVNPEREMPEDAFRIHGLSDAFLAEQPLFGEIVDELLAFLEDAPLVIHNAKFDMAFLNAELSRAGREPLPLSRAVDTLSLALRRFPGAPASLDALCRRFGIDNAGRVKHGALLDSELLAAVYLQLLGGRQADLDLAVAVAGAGVGIEAAKPRPPRPHAPTAAELERHAAFIRTLDDPVWLR
jgi:DNA polymerase-3 subunit epsilon